MYQESDPLGLKQMVRLPMGDARWPPSRLGKLGVKLLRGARDDLASVIRIIDLLAGLNKLDIRLGKDTAVDLLQALECLLVVFTQETVVADRQHGFLVTVDAHRDHALMRYPLSLGRVAVLVRLKPNSVRRSLGLKESSGTYIEFLRLKLLVPGDWGDMGILPPICSWFNLGDPACSGQLGRPCRS